MNNAEHLYKVLLDNHEDFFLAISDSGLVLELNHNVESICMISRLETIGKKFFDICSKNKIYLSFGLDDIKKISEKKSESIDVSIKTDTSTTFLRFKVIKILGDNQTYYVVIGKDITELLGYKKASIKSQMYLQTIIENLPEYVYWKDVNFVYQGCNKLVSEYLNLKSPKDIIGKTDNDFGWSPDRVSFLRESDESIILSGKKNTTEDIIPLNNTPRIMLSTKAPLYDNLGKIMGIIGVSVDITEQKNMEEGLKKAKKTAEETLDSLKQSQTEEQRHREKSEQLAIENAKHKAELEAQAEFTRTIDEAAHDIASPMGSLLTVIESLCGLEETTTVDGFNIALLSEKTRQKEVLYIQKNDSGLDFEVIGSDETLKNGHISWDEICVNIKKHAPANQNDISVFQKECLAILLKILVDRKIIGQGINEKRVPEDYRIKIRDSIEKISDITNDLISRYVPDADNKNESKQLVLIATILSQLVSEKRRGLHAKGIEVKEDFSHESLFAFANIQRTQVNRAISNIMNNASQAFDGKPGTIILKLYSDKESVYVSISDNGKGMPSEMIEKIKNKIAFTEGKKDGHGIGLGQVHSTLERNHGEMTIESKIGAGTTFTLIFSKKQPPLWAIDKIEVRPTDIILILDDDKSIHGAWDLRFKNLIKKYPGLQLQHFFFSADLFKFLDTLPSENKKDLFLLTDYELSNQKEKDNGAKVIEEAKIKRSILVTSHFAKTEIQNKVMSLSAKLLPKKLVGYIPIVVNETQDLGENTNTVDAIWLDDDPSFTSWHEKKFIEKGKKIIVYRTPKELLDNIHLYPKDKPIFLDNNFARPFANFAGTEIAKKLHEMGFSKLILITGDRINQSDHPYLIILHKSMVNKMQDYF